MTILGAVLASVALAGCASSNDGAVDSESDTQDSALSSKASRAAAAFASAANIAPHTGLKIARCRSLGTSPAITIEIIQQDYVKADVVLVMALTSGASKTELAAPGQLVGTEVTRESTATVDLVLGTTTYRLAAAESESYLDTPKGHVPMHCDF